MMDILNTGDNHGIQEYIDTLNLFIKRVEKINEYSFVEQIREAKTGWSLSCVRREDGLFDVTSERRGPNNESIEATLLTFRLFFQGNDAIAISNIEKIYSAGLLSDNLVTEFLHIRSTLDSFLDVSGDFHVKEDSRVLTRREIMEALLYVDRAHAKTIHKKNTNAQKWVRRWKAEKFSEDLLNTLFVVIVSRTLKFVNGIRQLNVRAVAELQELL